MDILYAHDGATVATVHQALPDAPTDMAVRRLLHILEEKGHVSRKRAERGFLYKPRQPKKQAGAHALQHVLDTFFEGAIDQALATHLTKKTNDLSDEQWERMNALIQDAKEQGR